MFRIRMCLYRVRQRQWLPISGLLCISLVAVTFARGDGLPPIPPWWPLNGWLFNDTNFVSNLGYPPRNSFGLTSVPSFRGNAVQVAGPSALLSYNEAEPDGIQTNITCDAGSLEFWFRPDWSSANNGGSGPGTFGRLIELGAYTGDASLGWWSLYVDSGGTNIYFSAQSNGASTTYLSVPIEWSSNWWHIISLSYSSSNSLLY